ncbi:hypothetical protein EP331_06795 [bacterium]|nr:MAG: hypothetical protein EP331_06795 [bacterium]
MCQSGFAQDYPSAFGYTILLGTKNRDRLGVDPVEQRSFSNFGAGLFWDCFPMELLSFYSELEFMRRDGKETNTNGSVSRLNLFYLQGGFSAKLSYKKQPLYKPYLLAGAYATGLLFRNDRTIDEGYLRHALEIRLGLGITHVFFSRRFALESTYRNAYLTYKEGSTRQGVEGYYVTFRYYWSKSTLSRLARRF